jgi:hypothetical protein
MAGTDIVYLLWYMREWEQGEDTELLIGVYRSEADAVEAIERLKGARGFSDYPEGLEVHAREIGKEEWTQGYARMVDGVNIFDSEGP